MGNINKHIVVKSAIGAGYFTCRVPWACISIVTEEGAWPMINKDSRVGLLQLVFADLTGAEDHEERAFTEVARSSNPGFREGPVGSDRGLDGPF